MSHYRKEEKPSKTYGITRSRESNDQVERHRVRLVVKRYALKEGIDFNEIFSPIVWLTTVRIILALCGTFDLHIEQLDLKTTFLHDELKEEIYMLQLEGFAKKEKKEFGLSYGSSIYYRSRVHDNYTSLQGEKLY